MDLSIKYEETKMTALDQLKQIAGERFDQIKHVVINNVYLDLQ